MWTYEGVEVVTPPEKAYGFIYKIHSIRDGREYIGRKYLTQAHQFQRKNKIKKTRIESDWKDYYSSSPEILKEIALYGKHIFMREIIQWCYSRAECNYCELKWQFDLRVLEDPKYYNSNIASKHFKKNVLKFPSSSPKA